MKNPASLLRALALLVAVVLLVVGAVAVWNVGRNDSWWGTSDAQQRLLDDPMAARDLLGLPLVREDVAGPVGITGKARGSYVHHWFDAGNRQAQVLADLGAHASAHGWTQRADLSDETAWVGRKDVGGPKEASLIIHLEGVDGQTTTASEADAVRVSLNY